MAKRNTCSSKNIVLLVNGRNQNKRNGFEIVDIGMFNPVAVRPFRSYKQCRLS